MPTLHIRAVPTELLARLRAGARATDQALDVYALDILQSGLDAREARVRGGHAGSAALTQEQRSARASKAARARYDTIR